MRRLPSLCMVVGACTVALSVSVSAQAVPFGIGAWLEQGHGNHRAVVHVAEPSDAVRVHIPWRRHDPEPQAKGVLVEELTTGQRVPNVFTASVTQESGEIIFQPATGPGDYAVYYLPYTVDSKHLGDPGSYLTPEDTADQSWLKEHGLSLETGANGAGEALPEGQVTEIQARSDFNRFDPMEVAATRQEVEDLLANYSDQNCLLFPEDHQHGIRMFGRLPLRWIEAGPSTDFEDAAQPGEYFVFQIGVYAARQSIDDLSLVFSDLKGETGRKIPAAEFTCFNLEGTDWLGRPMTKQFAVGLGKVRALWIGVQIPRNAKGAYTGTVEVQPVGGDAMCVSLHLQVDGDVMEDAGDSNPHSMSRLRWLNSTIGLEDEVIPPFTPVRTKKDTVSILGRTIRFGETGLPDAITSNGEDVLASPAFFEVQTAQGVCQWQGTKAETTARCKSFVERQSEAEADGFSMSTWSRTEFDGCINMTTTIQATRAVDVGDIRLIVPMEPGAAKYMMGFSKRGGLRTEDWHWKWDIERADNMVWLGDVDRGLQVKLHGGEDQWHSFDLKPNGVPESWDNGRRGGCDVTETADAVNVCAYTGPRRLEAGQEVTFHYRFLVTPFKPIDLRHWNWRQAWGTTDQGENIYHVHHGNELNPYINYPFLTADRLRDYVKGLRSTETDFGQLTYPVEGNLSLAQGALNLWVKLDFDPEAGTAGQAQDNQPLLQLDFPDESQVGLYWNVDDHGMRVYVRKGPEADHDYPLVLGAPLPDWHQDQAHLVSLSWGEQLELWIDGIRLASTPYRGLIEANEKPSRLQLHGSGFILDAIKVAETPLQEGFALKPNADESTLLLDTFSAWDGGASSKPEKSGAGPGAFEGICERVPGNHGHAVHFASRVVTHPEQGVNLYYTVRELSNHVTEMWALRSLGDEVFETGNHLMYAPEGAVVTSEGGGYPWLREHLVSGYVPAWRHVLPDGATDAAIATKGLSRWHNYYCQGLDWLMKNAGIDGLYLDGIGYDREIMRRVARVMHNDNPDYRINFHSGNEYDYLDHRISPANKYMEHLPYISNLWFGEMYDYSLPADYWLVEISGIPFGLTGEMLEYNTGGNAYRGMIYGMSSRMHPSRCDMWRFWDAFEIQDAEMLSYWSPDCPVRTNHKNVLATVYRKPGRSLIALASWPGERVVPRAVAAPAAAPVVDGKINPEEWQGAARIASFRVFGDDRAPEVNSDVWVTHDDRNIYVGFRFEQPEGKPKASISQRDEKVYEDDAIELFLQPDVNKPLYVQFVGNSIGVFWDSEGKDPAWNANWTYRTFAGDGFWSGELTLPLHELGIESTGGDIELGFNVCRDFVEPQALLLTWAPVLGVFHDPAGCGRLTLAANGDSTHETPEVTMNGVTLQIDWAALGLDPAQCTLVAPPIEHFQPAAEFDPKAPIQVEDGKGWLLIVEERSGDQKSQ